jgi:PAS domain S-box-containing protein
MECTLEGKKRHYKVKQLQTAFEDGSRGITLIIEDITAHIMYQKMLELNEAQYRGIVEDQTEFITRFLPDGTLVFVNEAYARYLGKNKADLLGGPLIPDIDSHDIAVMNQCIQSLDIQNPVKSFECRIHHSCGQDRWNLWSVRVLFDDNKKPIEYQGIGRDNTEKHEAAARINQYVRDMEFLSRKSQEFVELSPDADIFQVIGQGLSEIIPGALITVNSIDVTSDSLTVRAVLPNQDRELLTNCLGKDLQGFQFNISLLSEEQKMKFFSTLQEGKLVHSEESLHTIFFQLVSQDTCNMIRKSLDLGDSLFTIGLTRHGIIFGAVAFSLRKGETLTNSSIIETFIRQASIVLHRRLTEDALKESEKLYRSVIENIQDVFYRSDKDGNLILASPSLASMLGYDSLDQCIGKSIADVFYGEPEKRKLFLDSVYAKGRVNDYEVILKTKDGLPLYVSTNSHLYFDNSGNVIGVEGIFRDISEQHAAAEKIRHHIKQMEFFSQKLQELIELSPDADIFEKIATDLKLLIADAMISVNSFNGITGILTCRSCKGDEDRASCTRYLGRNPEDIDYPIDPVSFQTLSTGRLHKVPFSLFDVLFKVVPKETCDQIVEAVKIGDIYGIGFVRGDILFGNATIFLHKGAAIHDIQLIETYARAASIALQRKVAEDALRESEEIFSSVAQYAPFPIAIIEPDGTYRYVNQKFVETFGYDLNDFKTGREWFSLAYPDPVYRKKVIDTWKSDLEASESGIERPEIFTVRCKNGVDREIVFRPVTLSDKKQCIVYEDLMEQHKAEYVQKLLSLIVETTSDSIIGEKIDGTIISINPAAEQLYGYTKEEVIGRNISIIIPQNQLDESNRIVNRIKKGESINNLKTHRVCKDGKVIDVEVTISPITDETGIVIGASTIARDISYKKSEERLRESEEKYRVYVENMNIGIYRSTGDPMGRFVWGNSSLVEILGYPSFDTLQQIAVTEIFTEPDGRRKLLEDLQRFGFVKNREISLNRADGARICVSVTALAKFDPAGKIEFINGIVEDVTNKKQISPQVQRFRHELVDLIECLPDPTFVVSDEHKVIAWNAAMEQMTGVSKNEIIGSEEFEHAFPKNISSRSIFVDLITLIDAADNEIGKHDPPITREGSSLVAEGYFPSLYSGRGSYVWATASPLIGPDGRRTGAIEVIHDISQVKDPNQLLKNAKTGFMPDEEILIPDVVYPAFPSHDTSKIPGLLSPHYVSNALKMARDYIAILDRSGKCVWVNDALVSVVNAGSCNDLIGKSIALYIAPEFRKMALNSLIEVKKNGNKTVTLMMLSSSGRVPVETNISAITTEKGDLFGYMAIARNVEQGKVEKPR